MGTPSEVTTDEVSSGKLQQNLDPDSGTNKSESKEKGNCQSMSAEVVSGELQKRLSPDEEAQASKSNREESADPIKCQEISSEIKLSQHDKGIDVLVSNQDDSSLSRVNEKQPEHVHQKQVLASEGDASEFSQVSILPKEDSDEKSYGSETGVKDEAVSLLSGKASDPSHQLQSQKMEVFVSQSDQRVAYSIRPEKALDKLQPRRNPDTSVQGLPSDQGSAPSRAPEKPSEDGYNWRKYGQKLVRGNEFTRSYYKCTYSNCLAKKQVERSHDGHITDIHYIGNHEHPKPLNSPQISPEFVAPLQMRRSDMPIVNTSEAEGTKSTVLGTTCQRIEPSEAPLALENVSAGGGLRDSLLKPHKLEDEVDKNGGSDSKRQKKDVARSDDTPPIKSHSEPRHIVETMCDVDIVNDGYRWRKYGQKIVKGNPNPRSYYRCSSTGCRAKKHVERASHNPKLVITTYEGKHDHDTPTSRTITQNSAGTDCNTIGISGESRSESGENKHVSLDMVVHIGAN